jgi:hypothetical protein
MEKFIGYSIKRLHQSYKGREYKQDLTNAWLIFLDKAYIFPSISFLQLKQESNQIFFHFQILKLSHFQIPLHFFIFSFIHFSFLSVFPIVQRNHPSVHPRYPHFQISKLSNFQIPLHFFIFHFFIFSFLHFPQKTHLNHPLFAKICPKACASRIVAHGNFMCPVREDVQTNRDFIFEQCLVKKDAVHW